MSTTKRIWIELIAWLPLWGRKWKAVYAEDISQSTTTIPSRYIHQFGVGLAAKVTFTSGRDVSNGASPSSQSFHFSARHIDCNEYPPELILISARLC